MLLKIKKGYINKYKFFFCKEKHLHCCGCSFDSPGIKKLRLSLVVRRPYEQGLLHTLL